MGRTDGGFCHRDPPAPGPGPGYGRVSWLVLHACAPTVTAAESVAPTGTATTTSARTSPILRLDIDPAPSRLERAEGGEPRSGHAKGSRVTGTEYRVAIFELGREPAAGRYNFAHALIQNTLHEDPGPTRRARTHRQVAEVPEDPCGDVPGPGWANLPATGSTQPNSSTSPRPSAAGARLQAPHQEMGSDEGEDGWWG